MRGTQNSRELLAFEFGEQRCAISVASVQEIVRAVTVNPLPDGPSLVRGLINVRGRGVPVIDLGLRFGAPRRPVRARDHFILAWAGSRLLALHAGSSVEILPAASAHSIEVEDPPAGSGFIAGAVQLPNEMLLIYDLDQFLSQAEGLALDRALAENAPPGQAW
jgi:purine-binding chemotaxis protein CheW